MYISVTITVMKGLIQSPTNNSNSTIWLKLQSRFVTCYNIKILKENISIY